MIAAKDLTKGSVKAGDGISFEVARGEIFQPSWMELASGMT